MTHLMQSLERKVCSLFVICASLCFCVLFDLMQERTLAFFFDQVLAECADDYLTELPARRNCCCELFTKDFSSSKPKGNALKCTMAPLFLAELLDLHAPKPLHSALKGLALEARGDKALCQFEITRFSLFYASSFISVCGPWRSYHPPSMMPSKTSGRCSI